jgi:hypothetical protein
VFDTVNGRDRVISDSTLFMDAPVPSVKIEGNLVYFTEKDQQGMHRIVVMNYVTNEVLFVGLPSKDVIVFQDVNLMKVEGCRLLAASLLVDSEINPSVY